MKLAILQERHELSRRSVLATAMGLALYQAIASTPALAFGGETRFEIYEGTAAIREGTGGTKVTRNGIDYWHYGQPPRKYRVIGLIFDDRGTSHKLLNRAMDGNVIGSPDIARICKDNGGDAVVVDQQKSYRDGNRQRTILLVVKYLS